MQLLGHRILVVEDNRDIVELLQSCIEDAGAKVTCVDSNAAAMAALKHRAVSAALVDYQTADGNCDPICEHLKRLAVPYLVCSGFAREDVQHLGGIYLQKPFRSEMLISTLRAAISSTVLDL